MNSIKFNRQFKDDSSCLEYLTSIKWDSGYKCKKCNCVKYCCAYAQIIENASSDEFRPFFNSYIDVEANIITDEWKGYLPLKNEYPNLKQLPSKEGENFPDLHIHIMNLKGWLRGIHHQCSEERLQGYFDEYHFRYNLRNMMNTIFDILMQRMARNEPIRLHNPAI